MQIKHFEKCVCGIQNETVWCIAALETMTHSTRLQRGEAFSVVDIFQFV